MVTKKNRKKGESSASRTKKRLSQYKSKKSPRGGGSSSLSDRFERKVVAANRRAKTLASAKNARQKKLAKKRGRPTPGGKAKGGKKAGRKAVKNGGGKKNPPKRKNDKKKEKVASQQSLDFAMDDYFFKAGKRDDPRLKKLQTDMDDYWANKPAAAPAAEETPAAVEGSAEAGNGYYTIRSDLVDVIREDAGYSRERICPRGSWCVGGVRRLCAPGFHGAELGMYESANCSGLCSPGFYCGAGSATPTEFQCGDSKLYCPDGSSSPSVAPPGWYTVDSSGSDDGDASLRADIRPCEPGHFCTDGIRIACRGGLYGGVGQLEVPTCSGLCERGYYCPVASTSARERECGDPSTFCPRGSSAPTPVADGYYTVGDSMTHAQNYSESVNGGWYFSEETLVGAERTRWEQRICEPGHFCVDGKRFECPPGVYGSSDGLRSIECDGSCSAGYFCDAKSTSPTQNECGAVDLYCPKRSGRPLDVSVGFFSVDAYGSRNGPETQRADVRPCDPGHFCRGAERFPCPEGVYGGHGELTDPMCSGLCERGYYCPVASTSAREHDCGDPSTFCPRGSSTPTPVADGYYTVGDAMISRSSAEAFRLEMSQNDSESVSGAWYFSEETLVGAERNRWEQRICEPGHFCVDGKRFECPPGVYGSSDGLRSIECDGSCSAGYFCDAKSTLPTQSECGAVDLYCPERSAIPRKVTRGRYTIGGDSNQTKTDEAECEPGHYCIGGIRYQCPPGTYGSAISLAGPINYGHNRDGNGHFRCDGWCPEGHMCVSGTSEPVPCPVGTYAYAGASECMLCPPRYSEEDMPPVDACVNSRDCCNY
eukprot:g3338.t1